MSTALARSRHKNDASYTFASPASQFFSMGSIFQLKRATSASILSLQAEQGTAPTHSVDLLRCAHDVEMAHF